MLPSIASVVTSRVLRPSIISSALLAAPTKVQLVVQGQTQQEQSNGAWPNNANALTIAWKSVSGATSYNIYRSADQAAYTLYANVSASSVATAYSTYVTNSGTIDYVSDVDCAYYDSVATNCVGSYSAYISNGQLRSPGSGGHYYPPDANGYFFTPNVGYTYKVSAVNGAGEGTRSTDSYASFTVAGKKIMNHPNGTFNGTLIYNDTTCPATSPLGYTTNTKWTTNVETYVNPYTGGGAVDGNFSTKGFNYLVLNIYSAQSGSAFSMSPEIAGDTTLQTSIGSLLSTSYGTLVANQWNTLKIPLADLMIDQIGGQGAVQHCYYKTTFETHVLNQTFWIEWYFSVT